jgi:hypothetical protein
MKSKIMGSLALVTGIALSVVVAYYSVFGLTALFAGAFVAVLLLGGGLEIAKLVLATTLHSCWNKLTWWMRGLFVTQGIVLMTITGIGIFGFLSQAHLEHQLQGRGPESKIASIDLRIENVNRKIERLKDARIGLDKTLASLTEIAGTGVEKAAKLGSRNFSRAMDSALDAQKKSREQLQPEFDRIDQDIAAATLLIEKLETAKLPHQRKLADSEAKIGPLKYAAMVMFGSADADAKDKAVRAMILLIMFVFDPLAISLVVAGSSLLMDSKRYARRKKSVPATNGGTRQPVMTTDTAVQTPVDMKMGNVASFAEAKQARTTPLEEAPKKAPKRAARGQKKSTGVKKIKTPAIPRRTAPVHERLVATG